jgi:flagellar biosynthetic protein FliR
MFKGIFISFFTINLSSLSKLAMTPEFFLGFAKSIFMASLLLASPIVFSNLIIMCILGVIARTVPQMNVLMISFVVNIGIGLFVLSLSSSEFFYKSFQVYSEHLGKWFLFITQG